MGLRATYEAFLASPSAAGALAPQASINYIPTLTSVADADAVLKHLQAQTKVLTKKDEKVLSAVEAESALCLDIETTIEFNTGGGAYLPGLDDNFLADRVVVFPMVHIVHFDSQQRIRTIRLYWDQASLLKQVEVIGSRAKNWPIRDGKEQARLIISSSSPGQKSSASSARSSFAGDPHASLSLFQPSSNHEDDDVPRTSLAPRATSAKPPPRDLHEILSPERAPSTGNASIQAKAGASKNFQPIRLFDEDDDPTQSPSKSPTRGKAGPKKYGHFEFGDGEEATPKALANKSGLKTKKHAPQWDFEDFVTPEKHSVKVHAQNERHFGWSDDEVEETPMKRPVVHQPRAGTQAHFEFNDDATPTADKVKAPRLRAQNKGLGLYKDSVLGEGSDGDDAGTSSKTDALNNVTKMVNNEGRTRAFDSHFVMADSSPNTGAQAGESENVAAPKSKKGLDTNWALYDQSPRPSATKENMPQGVAKERGINIGGDGMGGRKGSSRAWLFGDDGPDAETAQPRPSRKASGRAQNTAADKSFWDF
ncbi:uncharacterized protein J3D65DRAFT_233888 [Phyllosticta citribraziliensis]|uniref:Uncharacterized protein n=1 Tax=Phyllosticta citribraziliensis TaxID=989973 RepID=A0ABR1M5P2_9PEZI